MIGGGSRGTEGELVDATGARDGAMDGTELGTEDGSIDGRTLGLCEGLELGTDDGSTDGRRLGAVDGTIAGEVGAVDGASVVVGSSFQGRNRLGNAAGDGASSSCSVKFAFKVGSTDG